MITPIICPSLMPKIVDPDWFSVDLPCDDDEEVTQLEREHQATLQACINRNADLKPIGKIDSENLEEDEDDDEDEDDNDDDDVSESHDEEDEELEMEVRQERNSPVG